MPAKLENMAFLGEVPWHGQGVPISNKISTKQMLIKSGADFTVEKVPEYVSIDGKDYPTGNYSLYRTDLEPPLGLLGSVSKTWNVNQNYIAFDTFKKHIKRGHMELETGGVLDGGRMVWCLAKVKSGFSLKFGKKRDDVESYMLFSNPHKYGWSITFCGTQIRVVCWNTLLQALRGKKDFAVNFNHATEFDPNVIHEALALNAKRLEEYEEKAKFLAGKKASEEDTYAYFDTLFPLTSNVSGKVEHSRNAEQLFNEIRHKQPGAELGEGTWWQNFNAATYGVDHLFGNNDNTRLNNAFYGAGKRTKLEALDLAVKAAKAA